jgi:hypothetical protein
MKTSPPHRGQLFNLHLTIYINPPSPTLIPFQAKSILYGGDSSVCDFCLIQGSDEDKIEGRKELRKNLEGTGTSVTGF